MSKPPLKDSVGRFRTESLFLERRYGKLAHSELPPLFTLKEQDHEGLPSMRRIYLEIADPTEYIFAQEVLGSWDHWQRLTSSNWFIPHVEAWRRELEIKLRASALIKIKQIATEEGNSSLVASRYLAENGWEKKTKHSKGRPSKEEVARELRVRADVEEELDSAMERLNLN